METVILCGCSASERRIAGSFARYAAVRYFGENGIWRRGEPGRELAVYSAPQLPRMENLSAVLVLGSELRAQTDRIQPNLLPVFDSRSTIAARLLSQYSGAAIGCGTSPRDTFSLASFSEQKAVVSLQRNLLTLTGETVEPRDITLRLRRGCSVFEIMAFCAVMLLCGDGSEQEMEIL
ncbi:MAG: hypothetical protein ACOYJR_00675 [Acutalibacteraceae bacterium]|jgi:hypothetical protein